ncbi:hypothetical protein [uncultured Cohaesibacter sp.]|uniref:hypothetical protein n=1 Tax=uncultured Cohaesibacter sp. TaxID=1002546 RepID=UPI0029306372|nr:hypothetical protein [uncultured Cohaesibacter sp.]
MHSPPKEQGSTQRWIFFILIGGLIAIGILFVLSRFVDYFGPQLIKSPYSTETTEREVEIAGIQFLVPENMIRFEEQRNQYQLKQLDLVMLWPDFIGFNREQQIEFSDTSDQSNLVFVSISQPAEVISSSDRLFTVYSQYFDGKPTKGPATLIGFSMSKDSGFDGETIYFKPDSTEPFVARCIEERDGNPAICMRDIAWGDEIQVSYRFRPHLLKNWQRLDHTLLLKLSELLVK